MKSPLIQSSILVGIVVLLSMITILVPRCSFEAHDGNRSWEATGRIYLGTALKVRRLDEALRQTEREAKTLEQWKELPYRHIVIDWPRMVLTMGLILVHGLSGLALIWIYAKQPVHSEFLTLFILSTLAIVPIGYLVGCATFVCLQYVCVFLVKSSNYLYGDAKWGPTEITGSIIIGLITGTVWILVIGIPSSALFAHYASQANPSEGRHPLGFKRGDKHHN